MSLRTASSTVAAALSGENHFTFRLPFSGHVLSCRLLFSQGHLGTEFYVPFWVVITCQASMVSVRYSVGGVSCTRWDLGSPGSPRLKGAPRRAGQSPFLRRRCYGCRFRQRIRSPVRLLGWGRRVRFHRYVGMLRATSSSLGFLRCRPLPHSPQSSAGWLVNQRGKVTTSRAPRRSLSPQVSGT
jgi:hypothetical protein